MSAFPIQTLLDALILFGVGKNSSIVVILVMNGAERALISQNFHQLITESVPL